GLKRPPHEPVSTAYRDRNEERHVDREGQQEATKHDLDLSIRSATLNHEAAAVRGGKRQCVHQKGKTARESNVPRHLLVNSGRKRDFGRIEGAPFGRIGNVQYSNAFFDNADKPSVDVGGIVFTDLRCEPARSLPGKLRK